MAVPLQARGGAWQPALELDEPIVLVRCCMSPMARSLCMFATHTGVHVYAAHTPAHGEPSIALEYVTSFFLGSRATAATWSPSTLYTRNESGATSWRIEILAATDAGDVRILEALREEGGERTTTTRHIASTPAQVLDAAWCTAPNYESYAATACADGTAYVWNLEPDNVQCTPLYLDTSVLSVAFHPKVPKLLLTVESSGVGRLIDWLASRDEMRTTASFHEPMTLGAHATHKHEAQGAAAWQAQDADMVGALFGTRWCVWNVNASPVPVASGQLALPTSGAVGGFRFCPTNPRLFAVYVSALPHHVRAQSGYDGTASAASSASTSAVHVFDSAFPTSPRGVDVHCQTPHTSDSVRLNDTGIASTSTVPTAHGVQSIDWLPRKVGAYDVLLVGVGRRIVPVPVA